MAVGYHKINTSAARSKKRASNETVKTNYTVTDKYLAIDHPIYGKGKTIESFVSDADMVSCQFGGEIIVRLRGGAIRAVACDKDIIIK